MAEAAQQAKFETVEEAPRPEPMAPRRFGPADIDDMGLWLASRLRERYPHLPDRNLVGWLRGVIDSNEHLFLRTQDAVLLARMVHEPLVPEPIAQEVFMLTRGAGEAARDETRLLYLELKTWAGRIGASEIEARRFSDVPSKAVKEIMGGRMFVRERMMFKPERQP